MSKGKVTLFGVGRLGICTGLCLAKAGYDVLGIDVNANYVGKINKKTLKSPEPMVSEMLAESQNFRATTDDDEGINFSDIIMIVVATPSTGVDERHYDCSTLSSILTQLNNRKVKDKHVIICCTVLPGYCRRVGRYLLRDCENTTLSYNPEFIAQGDVINGLLKPDMVLIGEGSKEAGDVIEAMYRNMVQNSPDVRRMTVESAEICKLAVNCFITTKIAFANMIGDTAERTPGANAHDILQAIGADSRIGSKCLKPGFGFGGPCFPRDNRALGKHIKSVGIEPIIPFATDEANKLHTQLQTEEMLKKDQQEFVFSDVAYKEGCTVPIIEESQKLKIAYNCAIAGRKVTIQDKANIVLAVQQQYGDLFEYDIDSEGAASDLPSQPHSTAQAAKSQGGVDSYGVRRVPSR
mmetsp:Transcript_45033/g.105656  ORF Transcript_45033/g.105656 Transcript_45033/m.105656 type:complete len:408 (-) Transcript_45033:149-1372(-)